MARDILDHDDGVIDQDTDREDQREQADPVDRVAHEVRGEHGEQDRRGDDDGGHAGLAPADRKTDQDDDGDGRQRQMEQQLIGLLVRRRAIVAGDSDIDPIGDELALETFDPGQHSFGDDNGIGARPLGDRDADGGRARPLVAAPRPTPGSGLVLAWSLADGGDVAQIDRCAARRADGEHAHLLRGGQSAAGGDGNCLAALANAAGRKAAIGLAGRFDDAAERHAILVELGRVRRDPDLIWTAARQKGEADIVDLCDLGAQLGGEIIERLVAPLPGGPRLGRECEHDCGDVVDPAHRDLGVGNAHRDSIPIGAQLLVDTCRGVLWVRSYQEARRHHHAIIFGLGIDMLNAIDALDDGLERNADQFDGVGSGEARRHHLDVDHRHADLRLLLAGNREDGEQPDRDRRHQK